MSEFNIEDVFEVEDYMYFYSEKLTEERTDKEVNFLVRVPELDKPKRILDLACGFGRHAIKLAELGHNVVGIDMMEGLLDITRKSANEKEVRQFLKYASTKIFKYYSHLYLFLMHHAKTIQGL